MASPTIESLCCLSSKSSFSQHFLADFQSVPYNVVSIVAAVFGMGGALFQIIPWQSNNNDNNSGGNGVRTNRSVRTRGRSIVKWLAAADLMASFGILIRSASWLADDTFGSKPDDSSLGQAFCVITSAIIHYFYTATYMWSFVYALDVRLAMTTSPPPSRKLYHLIAWFPPLGLCMAGLLILYLPDLNCHSSSVNPYARFLPNYLSSFLPIVFVMIVNPILYRISFSRVQTQIVSVRGRYTHSERAIVDSLMKKFFLINLVFYLCWLPNIINGLVLWTAWDNLPKSFILAIWYMMAVMNPMQAVFNSAVYRRWDAPTLAPNRPTLPPTWTLRPPQHPHTSPSPIPDSDDEDSIKNSEFMTADGSSPSHERTPLLLTPPQPPTLIKDSPKTLQARRAKKQSR